MRTYCLVAPCSNEIGKQDGEKFGPVRSFYVTEEEEGQAITVSVICTKALSQLSYKVVNDVWTGLILADSQHIVRFTFRGTECASLVNGECSN